MLRLLLLLSIAAHCAAAAVPIRLPQRRLSQLLSGGGLAAPTVKYAPCNDATEHTW